MSYTIWGILQLPDASVSVTQVGQTLTFDAINELAARHNDAINRVIANLVGETTINAESYFETPGGGMMQEANRLTRPGAIKTAGRYNVGFPIRDARDQIAGDDVTLAYMTLQQVQRQVTNVFFRHLNWVRFHILRALFNNANETYPDEYLARDITVRRLANTDGTIYAPVINSETGADDNHYLVSGYVATAISNTNNPYPVIKAEIEEHFGPGNIVVFIHSDEQAETEALTAFVGIGDAKIRQPLDQDVIVGAIPTGIPGTVIGRVSGVWVAVWMNIPTGYMVGLDIDQEPPLTKRVDIPTDIGGRGRLELIAQQTEFPLRESFWRDRHGYGVSNRLSAVVMQHKAPGAYDIPTVYQ